jgi:putative protein kinase ArgK-like GTPase of G3E family
MKTISGKHGKKVTITQHGMIDMQDVFGINKYEGWTANKQQVYGIRGQGKEYEIFWKNYKKYNPIWEDDDWPWSYIAFDETGEKTFIEDWNQHISFQKRDEDDPPYDSVLDAKPKEKNANEDFLAAILIEEINKEINRDLINTIIKNVKVII